MASGWDVGKGVWPVSGCAFAKMGLLWMPGLLLRPPYGSAGSSGRSDLADSSSLLAYMPATRCPYRPSFAPQNPII